MLGSLTGLLTMVQNFLGIPMGATVQKSEKASAEQAAAEFLANNDFIASIVDITVDDVAIGAEPFYYTAPSEISAELTLKLDRFKDEFNSIAKWIARGLLTKGYGVYVMKIKKDKGKIPLLFPVLGEVNFVLNSRKEVVAYKDDKKITDAIIYINYEEGSLRETDTPFVYKIIPQPIQLAHVSSSAQEMYLIERALLRYRRDASRVIQYATVDVGLSQGEKQQDVIDKIAGPLNANSLSLEGKTSDLFDDELPVIPTRRELGKPNVEQIVPTANLGDLIDLDHVTSKLFLAMKFPKSYADFTQAAGETAVSLIRGDIRYSRMVQSVRSIMNITTNKYTSKVDDIRRLGIEFRMTEIPNPEDDEVVSALQSYSDFIEGAYQFIIGESETYDDAIKKIEMYESLLGNAVNLRSVQRFIDILKKKARTMSGGPDEDPEATPPGGEDGFGEREDFGGEGFNPEESQEEPSEEPPAEESEEQTE